ncbi:MAG: Nif11-like leader peptide family RiPP precursor [Scytonematopsis contorta HA4267-MV1]|nr:Nif11-like leader peptide family RiPP precursor [Scytonematopsis contorta HA4267-MV1]
MSKEAVNKFLQNVTEDSKLQEELTKALKGDNHKQAATNLAAKHGYKFTDDELWAELQERQSQFEQRQADGALNEEELEAVSGGFTPWLIAAFGGIVGAAAAK